MALSQVVDVEVNLAVPLHGSATPLRNPAPRPCTALLCLPQPRDPLCALRLPLAPRASGSALAYSPAFPTSARVGLGTPLGYPCSRRAPDSHPLPYYAPSNRPPRPATPGSCSMPRLRTPRRPAVPTGTLRLKAVLGFAPAQPP